MLKFSVMNVLQLLKDGIDNFYFFENFIHVYNESLSYPTLISPFDSAQDPLSCLPTSYPPSINIYSIYSNTFGEVHLGEHLSCRSNILPAT